MTSEEEINDQIIRMGYILASSRKIVPSFYKLRTDGTILKVVVIINHLIPDPLHPKGFGINSTNIVTTFVPSEDRRPQQQPMLYYPTDLESNIVEEDVEFDVLIEEFTDYTLTNGVIMSVKPVLAQVKKTRFFNIDGEAVYSVNVSPIIKIKKK